MHLNFLICPKEYVSLDVCIHLELPTAYLSVKLTCQLGLAPLHKGKVLGSQNFLWAPKISFARRPEPHKKIRASPMSYNRQNGFTQKYLHEKIYAFLVARWAALRPSGLHEKEIESYSSMNKICASSLSENLST